MRKLTSRVLLAKSDDCMIFGLALLLLLLTLMCKPLWQSIAHMIRL